MSVDKTPSMPVSVIGAGCAGLSLAARAAELPNHRISLIAPHGDMPADHIWGFWAKIGRAHVRTPVTEKSRMPSSA